MSIEDLSQALVADPSPAAAEESQEASPDYWFALIDETEIAKFLDLSVRSLQNYRYRGGGPRFVSVAIRCKKYRRIDGRTWIESKLRSNTAEAAPESEAA